MGNGASPVASAGCVRLEDEEEEVASAIEEDDHRPVVCSSCTPPPLALHAGWKWSLEMGAHMCALQAGELERAG